MSVIWKQLGMRLAVILTLSGYGSLHNVKGVLIFEYYKRDIR